MQAYFRAASVFLSASEHEGCGIPLLEAMAHDLPVVALARTAVPETMGRGGILVQEWDVPRLAELVHLLTRDEPWKQALLEGQRRNLARFSGAEARRVLAAAVAFLRDGKESEDDENAPSPDLLKQMVRERAQLDPATAALIVKGWLGSAGEQPVSEAA